jgi:hypothetical protein
LAASPLELRGHLQFVVSRSRAERQTLLNRLGDVAPAWADMVRVSDDLRVFQREYCYVEEVAIGAAGVVFRIHPRLDEAPITVRVEAIRVSSGRPAVTFGPSVIKAVPGDGNTRWRARGAGPLRHGDYDVRIWLEDHLAFEARLSVAPAPF